MVEQTSPAHSMEALLEETRYRILRLLESSPGMSQRAVARELGMSLGKVNYSLQALMRRGWIKANNFKNSQNKAAYMYLLTPVGIEAKTKLAIQFLRVKMDEYDRLGEEIERVRRELGERAYGAQQ
jgi:EPS-associated MarR family transcriptional regulator